jgi:hypothetical protein
MIGLLPKVDKGDKWTLDHLVAQSALSPSCRVPQPLSSPPPHLHSMTMHKVDFFSSKLPARGRRYGPNMGVLIFTLTKPTTNIMLNDEKFHRMKRPAF